MHGTAGFDTFIHEQLTLGVDIQAFLEHCLDTTQFQVTNSMQEIMRQHGNPQSILQINSSMETAIHRYKPGGTGLLLLGNICGRLEPNGRGGNAMGRWSFIHLRRRTKPPLTIISAYQVCPSPTNIIGNTAFHQQQRALHAQGRHNIHPRRALIYDLEQFLGKLLQRNHDIIHSGDFNEALTDKNSGIYKLAMTYNLVDPFLSKFPQHEEFGTHSQGKRRIDIILMTPQLQQSMKHIGYAPFDHATTSDHRPLLIEFHTQQLFGETRDTLPQLSHRHIKTKDKKSVITFINTMHQELTRNHCFDWQEEIDKNEAAPETVEMIDELIGHIREAAEKKCRKRWPEFYSQKIVQERVQVSILRGHLNAQKQGKDQLRTRMQRLGANFILPVTVRLPKQALRDTQLQLSETQQQSHQH